MMRKQRIDVILHILADQVEPDFRRVDVRTALSFQAATLSKVELASRKRAEQIDSAEMHSMVDTYVEEDGKVSVLFNSFVYRPSNSTLLGMHLC
jgi:hypothetical protein